MTTLRHKESIAWLDQDDRVVILDLDRLHELPLVLEGSSAAIWHAVDGAQHVAEIVGTVAVAFEVQPEEVEADVRAFLDDLAARGLLTREDGTHD